MTIKIKKSVKPIKYEFAINKLEDILEQIKKNKSNELIWILEHEDVYTAGTSFNNNDILDKSINIIKTNRAGSTNFLFCYRFKQKRKKYKKINNCN